MRVRDNSPCRLLPYRAAEGEPPKRRIAGRHGKVEVLGRGQQFMAYGRHPSGAELCWMPEPLHSRTQSTQPRAGGATPPQR